MGKRLTTEEFIERAKAVHGDRYGYDKVKYVNSATKVIITCPGHGDFKQTPNSHLSGAGCPYCAESKNRFREKLTVEEFIERAKKVHGNTYSYEKTEYVTAHTRVIITCPKHGDFLQTPASHYSQGNGCPDCGGSKQSNTEEFIERAKKVHGDTYSYEKTEYVTARTRVIITCPKHADFLQTAFQHLQGMGCPDVVAQSNQIPKNSLKELKKYMVILTVMKKRSM